jgi:polyphenol oxidase
VILPLADGRRVHLVFTDRSHGDLRRDRARHELDACREAIAPHPWTTLHQVHGAKVVEVDHPGQHEAVEADAAVTSATGAVLAVQTADCAPVALVASGGAVAVVHAGWKGLVADVVHAAAAALRAAAPGPYRAVLGPCIHAGCYEFGAAELDQLIERFGPAVAGTTAAGGRALDLPTAVRAALSAESIPLDDHASHCTACGDRWWSHRARGDIERQALVAWIEDGP